MDEDLAMKLRHLRLYGLLTHWDEYVVLAGKRRFSPLALLKYIVEEEYKIKGENARQRRLKHAQIPEMWVMETYPFKRQPKLNKKRILALYDAFDFIEKRQNIIWMGRTGCGKTGLATSFLVEAINRGAKGRYILFPELVNELYQSVADHSEAKVLKRYLSYDCLLIDELGHVEVEPVQVGLFFTLMHKRHKTKSTLITTNLGFSDWQSFLKNKHLTAALIDRLTEVSHVINMVDCDTIRDKLPQK
jgi:DNA replication protein DnaC